ncbi:MAG: hypothetical protein P8Q98_01695 [Candidatus Poseidoniaceae archaeon]|nr:hypothetical protein [Candidatus Poseidoniaceae archaeon]
MVEILCPHCDEEIELDDDASGTFACPFCEGEFEWNVEEEDDIEDFESDDGLFYTTDFRAMPAVRLGLGISFSIWMGLYALLGLWAIVAGMILGAAESDFGTGTSFGILIIVFGLLSSGIGVTGVVFGIKTARGDLIGVIVTSIVSGISVVLTIFQWDGGASILSLLIQLSFLGFSLSCLFVPILKAQFTGVLVTRRESLPRPDYMGQTSLKGKNIHPFEWVGHGFSLVLFIFTIVSLSSTWYSVEYSDGDSYVMGLTEIELTIDYGSVMTTDSASYSDLVDELQADYDRFCLGGSSSDCFEELAFLEYWESWELSGSILWYMLMLCLFVSIASILGRILTILVNLEVLNVPDVPYMIADLTRKFAPFVISGVLFLGTIIYMILSPGADMLEFPGVSLESGFGMIAWFSLGIPIVTVVLGFYELEFSR